ncbi:hypothetical protein SD70_25070 [Gordoniibacillus kamchatkensis]|uniref:Thioredoxin family protein n=1 Tax=Gordoniibacillus kamchatkensis TaxID=1590651 RepID=A0ABR5ACB5_9BACL|nr:thioredoxin family protein [Paenibacillus sp. VKM B-2647]KIL38642.1 hypothetical protein SD70_25070 [Paenibacillus sp. VKM B-2647]
MEQLLNLKHKIGQGISPLQFMDGMQVRTMKYFQIPNTKERFIANYDNFAWTHEEDKRFFATLGERSDLHCLILCTDWCPDVIWNVPVLFRVMEQSRIPTEVLIMEEHLETMDLFLTGGGRAQPIAVFLKTNGDVLGKWGARPAYIQAVMDRFKKENPDKQHASYQENLNRVYTELGELYHAGNEYQDVMIQELRKLFAAFEL